MATFLWWREISTASKWGKLHSFSRWIPTRVITRQHCSNMAPRWKACVTVTAGGGVSMACVLPSSTFVAGWTCSMNCLHFHSRRQFSLAVDRSPNRLGLLSHSYGNLIAVATRRHCQREVPWRSQPARCCWGLWRRGGGWGRGCAGKGGRNMKNEWLYLCIYMIWKAMLYFHQTREVVVAFCCCCCCCRRRRCFLFFVCMLISSRNT